MKRKSPHFMEVIVVFAIILVITIFGFISQTQFVNHFAKGVWGSTVGIKYHIVLYNTTGTVIRDWHTQSIIDEQGSTAQFYDAQNNKVYINGTFVIEQE